MTKRLIIATLASAVVLTACNKGTISSKRLDGVWNLTSGETKEVVEVGNGTAVLYTNTTTSKLDGKTSVEAFSSTSPNYPAKNTTKTYTSKFTFDNGSDSYTMVEVSQSSYTSTFEYFFSDANCNTLVDNASKITNTTSTTTEKGGFQVLGSTGDIENNTRILLERNSRETVSNNVYQYLDGTTLLSAAYEMNNGCKLLPLSDTENSSNTDVPPDYAQIVTVKESTSSEMTMDISSKWSSVYTNSSEVTTITGTMTFTKE